MTPDANSYPSLGKPGGPGLFGVKGMKLPKEIEDVAKHLVHEKGKSKGVAIAIAINHCKKVCATGQSNVGKVNPAYRTACCKAIAEWEKDKSRARADN